jgi:hypothetical protein
MTVCVFHTPNGASISKCFPHKLRPHVADHFGFHGCLINKNKPIGMLSHGCKRVSEPVSTSLFNTGAPLLGGNQRLFCQCIRACLETGQWRPPKPSSATPLRGRLNRL